MALLVLAGQAFSPATRAQQPSQTKDDQGGVPLMVEKAAGAGS
jgi:hypothetical protein